MRNHRILSLVAFSAALALPATAGAHVHLDPEQAPAAGSMIFSIVVPHGCEGSPTTGITLQLPPEVLSAKPAPLAGWTLSTTTEKVDPPQPDGMGGELTERTATVAWSGGNLPDGQLVELRVQLTLPDSAGTTLYVPTLQTCKEGETRWIERPAAGQTEDDLKAPAPSILLAAASAGHGHGDAAAPHQDSHGVTIAIILGVLGAAAGCAGLVLGLRGRRRAN